MTISPAGFLYVGTKTAGIFRSTMTTTSASLAGMDQPSGFELRQNHPNPFNPSTTVTFSLPARAYTTLLITDALGRTVATLVDEELTAGTHTRVWNAGDLPSGTYFCRISSGMQAAVRKLVLQK
jgi:hypothetical protein